MDTGPGRRVTGRRAVRAYGGYRAAPHAGLVLERAAFVVPCAEEEQLQEGREGLRGDAVPLAGEAAMLGMASATARTHRRRRSSVASLVTTRVGVAIPDSMSAVTASGTPMLWLKWGSRRRAGRRRPGRPPSRPAGRVPPTDHGQAPAPAPAAPAGRSPGRGQRPTGPAPHRRRTRRRTPTRRQRRSAPGVLHLPVGGVRGACRCSRPGHGGRS